MIRSKIRYVKPSIRILCNLLNLSPKLRHGIFKKTVEFFEKI